MKLVQKVEIKNDWQVDCIPWKTVTKNKNRFAESNNILIQSLKDNAKNKNKQLDKCLDQLDSCRQSVLTP